MLPLLVTLPVAEAWVMLPEFAPTRPPRALPPVTLTLAEAWLMLP